MPKRSTDKLVLRGPQTLLVLRRLEGTSAQPVARLTLDPASPAAYIDQLPHELTSGRLRELTYEVNLQNHAGQSAGSSNPAYSAAGSAPAPLTGLAASVRPEGVRLAWKLASGEPPERSEDATTIIRITRKLEDGVQAKDAQELKAPSGKESTSLLQSGSSGVSKEPLEQELIVKADRAGLEASRDPGTGLDAGAILNHKYNYTAERVLVVFFGSHRVEVSGLASAPVQIDAIDVFPPKAPQALAAIAVPAQGSIDLSWTPNSEADLAAYALYRREGSAEWVRIRTEAPIVAPEFRDTAILHGLRYSYAVTAIDENGNESRRSAIVEETLP